MSGQPQPRTLHIFYRHKRRQLEVCDEDRHTVLYRAERRLTKPQLTIWRITGPNGDEELAGRASINYTGYKINLSMPGDRALKMSYEWRRLFPSLTMHGDGIAWRWRNDTLLKRNLRLVGADGSCLAKFDNAMGSRRKQGTIAIMNASPTDVMDLLIVSGLAVTEWQRWMNVWRYGCFSVASAGLMMFIGIV